MTKQVLENIDDEDDNEFEIETTKKYFVLNITISYYFWKKDLLIE